MIRKVAGEEASHRVTKGLIQLWLPDKVEPVLVLISDDGVEVVEAWMPSSDAATRAIKRAHQQLGHD